MAGWTPSISINANIRERNSLVKRRQIVFFKIIPISSVSKSLTMKGQKKKWLKYTNTRKKRVSWGIEITHQIMTLSSIPQENNSKQVHT